MPTRQLPPPKKSPPLSIFLTSQFIDPLILMREARREAGRRISFLIAEKSMHVRFIGSIARAISASNKSIHPFASDC
jgi:hypothetical protein